MKKFIKPFIGLALIACLTIGVFVGCGEEKPTEQAVSVQESVTTFETLINRVSTEASPESYTIRTSYHETRNDISMTSNAISTKNGTGDNLKISNTQTVDKQEKPVMSCYLAKVNNKWVIIDEVNEKYYYFEESELESQKLLLDVYKTQIPFLADLFLPQMKENISKTELFKSTIDNDGIYKLKFEFTSSLNTLIVEVRFSETHLYEINLKTITGNDIMENKSTIVFDQPTITLPSLENYTLTDKEWNPIV